MDEKLLLMDEQRKQFLEVEFTAGGGAMKIFEMTMKDLEYYIHLKQKQQFERLDSYFERSSTVGKMISDSIACYRGIAHERKSQSVWQTSLLSDYKEL